MTSSVQQAFRYCESLAKSHYENFPIGWFIPKLARKYLYAIYAFARTADDFSDEEMFEGQRLEKLNDYEKRLDQSLRGEARDPIFIAVGETLEKTGLPPKLLRDLLVAFRMDVSKKHYQSFKELENYCTYSANPVGRIVLLLFGFDDPRLLKLSDKICTGIQLVNHWQDIGIDLSKGRVYLPKEDLGRFGYSYEDLQERKVNDDFRALMKFQISRTRSLFYEGKSLLKEIGPHDRRLRWQLAFMWMGPMRILEKIESVDYNVFQSRPKLSKKELIKMAFPLFFRGQKAFK
jgi:squalene synthase HpnC